MKIHIFGALGTGVSTLGSALPKTLDISYLDSDLFFWEPSDPPFTQKREPLLRNALIQKELQKERNWILGGSVINWGSNVFPNFDLIVFLWLPTPIRIARLKQREISCYGTIILNKPKRKKLFNKFINWAADYDQGTGIANRTLKSHLSWLDQQHTPILRIEEENTTTQRINLILNELQKLAIKKEM